MKRACTVVLFLLFTIDVFVDGNEELVSVTERDSVTLKSGVTEIKTDDEIEWRCSGSRIATISRDSEISVWVKPDGSFRDRLQLDNQTGDLKIINIRTADSGEYKVKISSPRPPPPQVTFTVKVVSADEEKSVSVMEGDSVTLQINISDIQRYKVIRWHFKTLNYDLAQIYIKDRKFSTYDGPDGRFRNRLTLDHQTGSLTITNITNQQDGFYEVEISSTSGKHTIHKSLNLTVGDTAKPVSVMEGGSVTLKMNLTIQRDDQILWKFGDRGELIADLNGPVGEWTNIYLNSMTGDLTISNIQRKQSGDYKVEINTRRIILQRKYHINIEVMVSVSVMAGDSVTLHNDFIIKLNKHGVLWFDHQDSVITQGRLTGINDTTGDLTIRNIRVDQSGIYKVKIISSSTMDSQKKFHVNISGVFNNEKDGVKMVSVMNGDSVLLYTGVTEIQNDVPIEWIFVPQNLSIAKTDGKSNNISYNNDVRFKNNLNLDIQTGDLRIHNSSTEHSGLYQLKIIKSAYIIQKSFCVAVSGSGLSLGPVAWSVVIVVLLVVVAAVAGVKYRSNKKTKKIIREEDRNPNLLAGNVTELVNT